MNIVHTLVHTDEFLFELSSVATRRRDFLHHAIVLFQKEAAGLATAFALDYEVLHAFLFPSIQKSTSTVSPSLARYILTYSRAPFFLPPGTVTELVRFAKRCFPAIRQFEETLRLNPPHKLSKQDIEHIIDSYTSLIEPNAEMHRYFEKADTIAFVLAKYFEEIVEGFAHLQHLVAAGKLVPMGSLFTGWESYYEPDTTWIRDVEARLSARTPPKSKRSPASNHIDTVNLDVVAQLNRHETKRFLVLSRTQSDSAVTRPPFNVQFLTDTRPILRLGSDPFGDDPIERALKVLPPITKGREHPWCVCPVFTAALHSAFHHTYGTPAECLSAGLKDLSDLSRLHAEIFLSQSNNVNALVSECVTRTDIVDRCITSGAGRWYLPLRDLVARADCDAPVLLGQRDTELMPDDEALGVPFRDQSRSLHFLSGCRTMGAETEQEIINVFGINRKKVEYTKPLHYQGYFYVCKFDDTELMSVEAWPKRRRWSIRLPLHLNLEAMLSAIKGGMAPFYDRNPRVRASYAVPETYADMKTNRLVIESSKKDHTERYLDLGPHGLTIADLLLPGSEVAANDFVVLPERISILSSSGDLHIVLPTTGNLSHSIVYNTDTSDTILVTLEPWLAIHPWKLVPTVPAFLRKELSAHVKPNS